MKFQGCVSFQISIDKADTKAAYGDHQEEKGMCSEGSRKTEGI